MMTRQSDRRRHPRSDVSWLVVVEAGKRRFLLQTVDISARGAKVRPRERLDIGTPAQLRFRPPDGIPFLSAPLIGAGRAPGPYGPPAANPARYT